MKSATGDLTASESFGDSPRKILARVAIACTIDWLVILFELALVQRDVFLHWTCFVFFEPILRLDERTAMTTKSSRMDAIKSVNPTANTMENVSNATNPQQMQRPILLPQLFSA